MLNKNAAQYMSSGSSTFRLARHRRYSLPGIVLSALLAFTFLLTAFSSTFGINIQLASATATEQEVQKEISDAYNDYAADTKDSEDPIGGIMGKFYDDTADNQNDPGSFAYVLKRMFTPGYINNTPNATAPVGFENRDENCDPNSAGAGTLIYHNCDVPNIFTEFLQDLASNLGNSGAQNAEVQSAKLNWEWFGLPSGTPDGGVPDNPDQRSEKFTAMELYGYNMRYTSYNGEWDRIKVLTEARALSNFGLMDHLKLAGTSVTTGIAQSLDRVATGFISDITTGNFIGAIGGFFTNSAEGYISGSVNSALDTSDLNVFNMNAWYRVGYGDTIYNARELTSEEMSAQAEAQILSSIADNAPTDAKAPEDLRAIQRVPQDPQDAISSCIVKTGQNGNSSVWSENYEGFTEDQCQQRAETVAENHNSNVDTYNAKLEADNNDDAERRNTFSAEKKWDREGTQKEETLAQWQSNNASFFSGGVKYNVGCELNDDNGNRAANLSAFKQCWNSKYPVALETFLQQDQEDINSQWFEDSLSAGSLQSWINEDPQRNFNAPWSRFVCVDDTGADIVDSQGILVTAYDQNGSLNPECDQPVRPPIQNGLFGNGYNNVNEVPTDTRHPGLISLVDAIIPVNSFMTWMSNLGLLLAGFMTRISNTLINLSFSPILETLGLNDLVVKGIEGFRDGIFFPIVVVVAGIGGVMLLVNGVRQRNYGSQIVSGLMMALTVITGVLLMYRPADTVKAVDVIPAQMEALVVSSIYNISAENNDPLCTSSGTENDNIFDSVNESTRTLMCENWRTFLFNPWVAGQYGTDYQNLNAATSGEPNRVQNDNSALVGDASVVMGDGITANNWAIYQLETMSAGTTTHDPVTVNVGSVNPDFYRIVDMQAGPNNGAASDGRFLEMWSGNDSGGRMTIGLLAPVSATMGAVTVLFYSVAKIQIAFVTTLMVLLLPVMFLIGVHPTAGRMKLKQYFGTLAGLMLQRVILVVILAVFFLVMVGVGQSSGNYWINAILSIIISVVFLYIRKPMLNAVFSGVSSAAGGVIGGRFIKNASGLSEGRNSRDNYNVQGAPRVNRQGVIGNTANRIGSGLSGALTGAVGGYIANGSAGIREGAREGRERNLDAMKSRQRYAGYRPVEKLVNAAREGTRSTVDQVASSSITKRVADETMRNSVQHQKHWEKKDAFDRAWDNADDASKRVLGKEQTRQILDQDSNEWISEPQDVSLQGFLPSSAGESRKMSRIVKLKQQSDQFRKDKLYDNIDHDVVDSVVNDDVLSGSEDAPHDDKEAVYQSARDRSRESRIQRDSDKLLRSNPAGKMENLKDREKEREDIAYELSGMKRVDDEQIQRLNTLDDKFAADKARIREESSRIEAESKKQREKDIEEAMGDYDPNDDEYTDY